MTSSPIGLIGLIGLRIMQGSLRLETNSPKREIELFV